MKFDPLHFDYELLSGKSVISIKARGMEQIRDGSTVFERVAICFAGIALVIFVNEDTDEIVLEMEENSSVLSSSEWKDVDVLSSYVGCEAGWSWVGRNYRGYADMFVMSFDGIRPQIAFSGAGSMLSLYAMQTL